MAGKAEPISPRVAASLEEPMLTELTKLFKELIYTTKNLSFLNMPMTQLPLSLT